MKVFCLLLYCSISIVTEVCVLTSLEQFEITNSHLCLSPISGLKGGSKEMCCLIEMKNETTSFSKYNGTQVKDKFSVQYDSYTCSVAFSYNFKHHMETLYCQRHYKDGLFLVKEWKIISTNEFTIISQPANLELNVLMYTSSLWESNWLECSYLLLVVTSLIPCVWKLTIIVFDFVLWGNRLFLRSCKLYFQKESLLYFIQTIDHSNISYSVSYTNECIEVHSRPVPFTEDVDTFVSLDYCSVSSTIECIEAQTRPVSYLGDIDTFRSLDNKKAEKELNKNLHRNNETEASGLLHSANSQHLSPVTTKHLSSPTLEAAPKVDLLGQDQNSQTKQNASDIETTSYATNILPGATASHNQHYETKFDEDTPPLSMEETRKNVRPVPKEKDVDSLLQSYQKTQRTPTAVRNTSQPHVQDKTKSPSKTVPSSSVNKPHKSLPRRACLVHHKEQYHLDNNLLSQPRATKFLVKVRTEICPGRFMAKLELQCSSKDDRLPNLDATQQTTDTEINEQVVEPTRERKHFPFNITKTGYVFFSSNLDCFSGSIQYPLPNKKAIASRIGYGGNAIVFVVFHAGKEFAVKKTVYRSKEISVHSQLCHPNIINLEAVLIGEKHERHKDKHYIYCFMPKMDINFRNVLSTKEHGCLKHMKMQLLEKREQWEVVLVNVKHVLRSVLKALDYMHSQGLVHRDIKASNILIKMICQCTDVLYCNCQRRKFLVQIGDFDSSATVPGYQLRIEEHQMIRYATVLPLGTMGYRAPEVSMHLVLSGPYEVLYTTSVDIWSFGCLLLTIFIGKSGPLKQRGEASLLLSAQDHPYSQELYQNVIKIKEVQKYYANTSGVCDLVHKCLQVQPHCRPTAKELLQLDFFAI